MSRRTPLVLIAALVMLAGGALSANQRATTGTARIEGLVTSDDGSAPMRRAIVTLSGSELSHNRSAVSDDNGAFVFADLPAGLFSLTATRPSFIASAYGAKGPGRPGTRISLAAGQVVRDAVIRMARGAVVAGTVRNESGQPMSGVQVSVVPARPPDARTVTAASVGIADPNSHYGISDEQGAYRVFGLAPGNYLVAATWSGTGPNTAIEMLSTAQMDEAFRRAQQGTTRAGTPGPIAGTPVARPAVSAAPAPAGPKFGMAPIFFPGTADPGAATAITLTAGQELTGMDIAFALTPTAAIEGEVINPNGPLTRVQLTLTPEVQGPVLPALRQNPNLSLSPATLPVPTGRFRYTNVPPGRYTITARTLAGQVTLAPEGFISSIRTDPNDPSPPNLWAFADVIVTNSDVSGVMMQLRPGLSINGRVQFDGTTLTPPTNLTTIRIGLARTTPSVGGSSTTATGATFGALPAPSGMTRTDGTFELLPVYPGTYRVTSLPPPATGGEWWLRSAIAGGVDLLDDPLTIATDGDTPSVVLTFSDRHTAITGSLQTSGGAPATDYFIVVFTAERRWWRPESRRVVFLRPATDGRFTFRDLPAGDYYLAALTDLDTSSWQSAEFLDQVVPAALRLTLGEGETKTQDLRIAR